ncbi:multidrug DMT transporter permease [Erysipelothrix larvae]|uniref:Multidrug DMT transporter permease n=1 Tax=Erysipelothrix larvae TaxID=1514105 RepID=A0A0X8GZU1_9FIRM|nr:EamA family transporter [Erysipelothrix larvae]AMC93269.1 multidrug DMT transporter permease [Erysipelothrix larvae]
MDNFELASAFFAGVTTILAKIGIKDTNANLATALRTIVVAIFAWLMVFIVGSQQTIGSIAPKSILFLVLSGLATGGSWLCYFKALQLGDVNKVVPVDKSSTILTMALAFLLLGESLSWIKIVAMVCLGIGTYKMIEVQKTNNEVKTGNTWLIYALLSALLASLTAILGKIGISGIESNLGTAIRTLVVLVMAWGIVFVQNKHHEMKSIDKKSWIFIILSGFATGLSWMCYYRALQDGPASIVVPIDKLSILVTVFFGHFAFKETLDKAQRIGLVLIVVGTLSLLI